MADARRRTTHADVVIIGAGIGGLSCGCLLARYGYRVTIVDAHTLPGGVAHAFQAEGYRFDAGPSSLTGMSDPRSTNAMRHVLDLVGEQVPVTRWQRWHNHLPEGRFVASNDRVAFADELERFSGPRARGEWEQLERLLTRLARPFDRLPPGALRHDAGALLTMGRYGADFLRMLAQGRQFTRPFSELIGRVVSDPFLERLLDLESFIISGLDARETLAGVMAIVFHDRNRTTIDYPHGGMQGLIDGFVRGFRRHGGQLMLNAAVDHILFERGRAVGVQLRRGGRVMAGTVVSNASVWDTLPLIPDGAMPHELRTRKAQTPMTNSFLHLHVGIDARGLPPLEGHHVVVRDWDVTAEQNVVIVSIPSLLDPSLAPPGKHCVHAYLAGNEPWERWAGLRRVDRAYRERKEARSQRLWQALEQVIPDVRERVETSMVGTPLTIRRYCRRHRGTYGPRLPGPGKLFPGPRHLGVPGLLHCGDSTMPGIGLPAAAASGMAAAHAIAPLWKQWRALDALERARARGRNVPFVEFQPGAQVRTQRAPA